MMAQGGSVPKPVLVGIAGDACSGKSSLAESLVKALGEKHAAVVCVDDYRRYTRIERRELGLSRVNEKLYFTDIVAQHMGLLRDGEAVLKPSYDRSRGIFDRPWHVEPKPVIFFEGVFSFLSPAQRDALDIKIYLEPDEALRRQWKLQRDVKIRGRNQGDVERELEQWASDAAASVQPQQQWADLVVKSAAGAADLPAHRLIMRPTLPRPSLAELFDAVGEAGGARLGLARDLGLPVDRIDVAGEIPVEALAKFKKITIDQVHKSSLRVAEGAVGEITGADGAVRMQPGLALTQLFILVEVATLAAARQI